MKVTKQYANTKNGGQERVTVDNNRFFISSNWGNGFGDEIEVTRNQMIQCMEYTGAPVDVVKAILG